MPKIKPNTVPVTPIVDPVIKIIFNMSGFFAPRVRSIAMSLDLFFTSMVMLEIILKAATKIIKSKIINITFLSTCNALKKLEFFCCHPITLNSLPNNSITSRLIRDTSLGFDKNISTELAELGNLKKF